MKEKEDSDNNSYSSESADSENVEYNNKDKVDSILNIEKNKNKNEIILNDSGNKNFIYNENEENDKINNINKCNSYNSVFSFANVTRKDFNNINFNNNINNNKIVEKIRVSELNDNNEISIWETIKQQLENVKNHIVFNFNIFSGLNNLDLSDEKLPKNIQIFDEKFSKQDEKLINVLQNIPWFSYRKNFNQIKDKENIFTTDAGWGCMIRASQMILAQGIYKLFSIKNLNEFFNEFITFFYDNKIPLKLLVKKSTNSNKDINTKKENKKQENKNNKIKEETFNDFLIVDITREHRLSFVDITKEMVEELENLSKQENNNQNLVTPPFL